MNRIETERLYFELYRSEDKDKLVGLLTDPVVMKYVDKGVFSRGQAEELWRKLMHGWYPQGVDTIWAVFAKEDGRFVGNASLRPRPEFKQDWEIGYYLTPNEWGKGFATEIARRLVLYAFENTGLTEVFATVDVENAASRKVLEKVGLAFYRNEFDELGVFCVYRLERDKFGKSVSGNGSSA